MSRTASILAAWGALNPYVHPGMATGNNVSNLQPRSGNTEEQIADLRARQGEWLKQFTDYGLTVFSTDVSYRKYTGVTPEAQQDGSLPYNEEAIWPANHLVVPDTFDESLGISRFSMFMWGLTNRDLLADQVHYGSIGGANYAQIRAEQVQTEYSRIYNSAWPKSWVELQVEKYEVERRLKTKREAQYVVSCLPNSAAKTALQNRVNAVVDFMRPIQISFGGGTGLAGWNGITANSTIGVLIANLIDRDREETGVVLTQTDAASNNYSNGMTTSTNPDFPASVVQRNFFDSANDIVEVLSGLQNGTYKITILTSRSNGGVAGTRNVNYQVNGGAVLTLNILENTGDVVTFTGVAVSDGTLTIRAARGSGNTVGSAIGGVIIERIS